MRNKYLDYVYNVMLVWDVKKQCAQKCAVYDLGHLLSFKNIIENMFRELAKWLKVVYNKGEKKQIRWNRVIFDTREIEEQRYGRNKSTVVNQTYINSGSYRKKFDAISDNPQLNRLLYQLAKKMLIHRSGTLYEDMYWIDLDTIEVVGQEVERDIEEAVRYSRRTETVIKQHQNLLTIHTHPNSFPPSIADINSNYFNNYVVGIVICHNGKIYMYNADQNIAEAYYSMTLAEYQSQGYTDFAAQECTLKELSDKFQIQVKEVTDNDVL